MKRLKLVLNRENVCQGVQSPSDINQISKKFYEIFIL
jgi:hypothetical protein